MPHANENGADTLTGLEIGLTLAAIKPLATAVVTKAKEVCGDHLEKMNASKLVSCLSQRAQDISQVKTLLCLEQPVLITEFYSAPHIMDPTGRRVSLETPEILRQLKRVVVAGVAGQGKSILFRYLALHDIAQKRLPLFIELRNFEHSKNVRDLLLAEIEALGFPNSEVVLNHLLEHAPTTLYLDAFDEIPHDLQSLARKQIEDLARRHQQCSVFVSTRPTLSIEASSHFRVARLDNLEPNEALAALRKMSNSKDNIERIEAELNSENRRITNLLTTPLMVALLLLHHRLSGEFPETEQAFFDDLFDVLLRRHDQTKGYTRKRNSNASELELHDLFGYTSFACRQKGQIELQRSAIVAIIDRGRDFFGKNYSPDGALRDIIEGTNLILEEGASCRFAHKAIQEFYAASFLSVQPETDIERFLRNRVRKWDHWEQMLGFIELINPHMFFKHFLIPHVGWIAFGDEEKRITAGWIPSKKVYQSVFGDDTVGVRNGSLYIFGPGHVSKFYLMRKSKGLIESLLKAIGAIPWESVQPDPELKDASVDFHPLTKKTHEIQMYRVSYLLEQPCGDLLRQELMPLLVAAFSEINKAYDLVELRSQQADFFA